MHIDKDFLEQASREGTAGSELSASSNLLAVAKMLPKGIVSSYTLASSIWEFPLPTIIRL